MEINETKEEQYITQDALNNSLVLAIATDLSYSIVRELLIRDHDNKLSGKVEDFMVDRDMISSLVLLNIKQRVGV